MLLSIFRRSTAQLGVGVFVGSLLSGAMLWSANVGTTRATALLLSVAAIMLLVGLLAALGPAQAAWGRSAASFAHLVGAQRPEHRIQIHRQHMIRRRLQRGGDGLDLAGITHRRRQVLDAELPRQLALDDVATGSYIVFDGIRRHQDPEEQAQ